MKKLEVLGLTAFLALSLASCIPDKDRTGPQMNVETNFEKSTAWRHYESEEFGISFDYPPRYAPSAVEEGEMTVFGSGAIRFQRVVLGMGGGGEGPMIDFTKSTDTRLLQILTVDHPMEKVTIGGKTVQKFVQEGMGTPVGYLLTEKAPYITVEFVFPPEESIIERVMQSIEIVQK